MQENRENEALETEIDISQSETETKIEEMPKKAEKKMNTAKENASSEEFDVDEAQSEDPKPRKRSTSKTKVKKEEPTDTEPASEEKATTDKEEQKSTEVTEKPSLSTEAMPVTEDVEKSAEQNSEETEAAQSTDNAEASLPDEAPTEDTPAPIEEIATDVENMPEIIDEADAEQFIIPEEATFTVEEIDTSEIELFPEEPEIKQNEKGLLDVEHFSDYEKILSEVEAELSSPPEVEEEYHSASYENLTILSDVEEEEELPPPKEKREDPDKAPYDPKKPRKVDGRFDFVELFIFTLLAVILLTTFVFRHSVVDGGSMEDTLHDGEHLIISNLFYTPEKGDIVVLQDRATGLQNPLVKRVIATEGDTIEILADGTIFVNEKIIDEPYVYLDGPDNFMGLPKTTVPEDMIFVLGDHRNNSTDSRTFRSTFVREDAVLGKVIIRIYPFDAFGKVD